MMHGAVDVGVLRGLIANPAVDYRLRHLARRRVVQKDERLAVDPRSQDRKVGAETLHVECVNALLQAGMRGVHWFSAVCVCVSTTVSSCSTNEATGMRSITSAPNA